MPVQNGRDSEGPYYRWGEKGHKYHYKPRDVKSRKRAREKAALQGRAIEWRKHGGGKKVMKPIFGKSKVLK
jgi:hypothetical protein